MPIVSGEQIVNLRTHTGRTIDQFHGDQIASLKWTREQREVSICDLTLPAIPNYQDLPTPWLHWVDVWNGNGDELYWSGPIVNAGMDHQSMTISASDVATLMQRTRCPVTKKWGAADPAEIAAELWGGMIERQGLQVRTITRHDPRGGRFDFSSSDKNGDTEMMNDTVTRLVDQTQLYWTVVAGTTLLGPASLESVAELGELDFLGDAFRIERDGSQSFNDVLLRVADSAVLHRRDMGGLNLQTIRDVNSAAGVSNADRAAQQFLRYTASIRDSVTMPSGAVLVDDAPVTIEELIPSARFVVQAYGLLSTMQLDQVTVTYSQGVSNVAVKLGTVNDELPELLTLDNNSVVTS